jgi:hypothetical protein
MADENKAPWLNYLALTTVIVAVCATLATFKGGGYSTRQVLSQAKASDQWAFFQAKSMKGDMYALAQASAELERQSLPASAPKAVQDAYARRVADYGGKVAKYEQEKAGIENDAKVLELARDDAQRHGGAFGIAVIFLQIAILLSSIAALLKKKPLWLAGLAVGVFGIMHFANGFFLFLK